MNAARAYHAAGLAVLAKGNYLTAHAQLSQLFDADGAPLYYHVSYLGIADLAAAAVRAERHLEARALTELTLAQVGPEPGPRLGQLAARARGLLAEPTDAEAHFAKGLSEPAGDTWPFERAQLQLDYGEWLRRQRRINDAKPVLTGPMQICAPRIGRSASNRSRCRQRSERDESALGSASRGVAPTRALPS